ncbi:MAG TPA: isochorismate synthase [Terrimesophilobacter sp.]|nr:isochorismate synthase [Terrimesophilobacter sp.]HRP99755.1 isochorismate synthase [Terrimesophilobacter sp.]
MTPPVTPDPSALPQLTVTTRPLEQDSPLLNHLDRERPTVWLRRGNGLVGIGETLRLDFSGPARFTRASVTWADLAARAAIDDTVQLAGTGLIAFGTFAFDDESAATSTLLVPSMILGRRDGIAWVTTITHGADASPTLPAPHPVTGSAAATFGAGTLDSHGYLDAVGSAIARIREGAVNKIVVARDLRATLRDAQDLPRAITSLAHGYPDCWTFAVDGFFGSSPETLVTVLGGAVTARVLAGSAARGADAASDVEASVALSTSTKDQDEHEFAVHSVVAALRRHGTVTASEVPFTLKLPNLWHLASDVAGTLTDGSTSLDLIAALHPTAAVAGTPTPDAIAAIRELEPFDRERYAGPVGWVGADGDGEWAIALRCAQVHPDGTITAWAGAGIVGDSVPAHELAETTMKFRPIVEAFGG